MSFAEGMLCTEVTNVPLGNVHWGAQTFQPTLLCFAQIIIQAFTCPGCVQPAWVYTSIPSFRTTNICWLDMRKSFLPERVALHWHRLSVGAVVSVSMEVFMNCGDVALGVMVSGDGLDLRL